MQVLGFGCVLLFLAIFANDVLGAPASAKIVNLPGWNSTESAKFNQYAGYIPFPDGKRYFYWFVESQGTPSTDPLVLWLNGGPGCSSLVGFFTEHGPMRPTDSSGEMLAPNPFSWNLAANMLYLESPVGVGFSYWPGNSGAAYGDKLTAEDNYQFLSLWIQQYPEYKSNPFFVTGESWGGHYVPSLVSLLVKTPIPGINLKGFLVGNPSTTPEDQGASMTEYLQTHALLPFQGSFTNDWQELNPYDVLVDVNANCAPLLLDYLRFPSPFNNFTWGPSEHVKSKRYVPNPSPCLMNWATQYLNKPAVQSAIHATATTWDSCSNSLVYNSAFDTMIPFYQSFLSSTDLTIWVYSGDADTVVNFIGTEQWIIALNLRQVQAWQAWYYNHPENVGQPQQIAGFGFEYSGSQTNIVFRTVKGAGHMVPTFQPRPALQLFQDYLKAALNK